MKVGHYTRGSSIQSTCTFSDQDGNPSGPSTVTISILNPKKVRTDLVYGTDLVVKRTEVGVYKCAIDLDVSGRWAGATGSVHVATERQVIVEASLF